MPIYLPDLIPFVFVKAMLQSVAIPAKPNMISMIMQLSRDSLYIWELDAKMRPTWLLDKSGLALSMCLNLLLVFFFFTNFV